jgi:hypothetical protein
MELPMGRCKNTSTKQTEKGRCILMMDIIRGKIAGAQKVVLYGPEGIGKSTFAAQFPNPLFIDTEGSTKHMDVARLPKPSSWTMLMDEVRYVRDNSSICNTLAIDTADWAESLCINHVCSKSNKTSLADFGHGNGYIYLEEEYGRFLNLLEEVIERGVNVCLTAHTTLRKVEQPDEIGAYDRWEMKLEKKTASLTKEWADMLLFANYRTIVINVDNQGAQKGKNKAQGGERVIYTEHRPVWDAKHRHGLQDVVPMKFESIAHCIPVITAPAAPVRQPTAVSNPPVAQTATTPIPIISEGVTYWHHPESDSIFELRAGEKPDNGIDGQHCMQLTKEEYMKLQKEYAAAEAKVKTSAPAATVPPAGLPKPLADLMSANQVTVDEIQEAVALKGYYPRNTPISNYDPQFINGVLVGAWPQVFQMILDLRKEDKPF